MLEVYAAAAAGDVNTALVADLQRAGCNALGLAGVDGRLLVARRKDAVRAVEAGCQRIIRDDFTGQLESANGELLHLLLVAGYTPVIAPLALGLGGERLNVDGDRAAALVAGARGAGRLSRRKQPYLPHRPSAPADGGGSGAGPHEEEAAGRTRGARNGRAHGHSR